MDHHDVIVNMCHSPCPPHHATQPHIGGPRTAVSAGGSTFLSAQPCRLALVTRAHSSGHLPPPVDLLPSPSDGQPFLSPHPGHCPCWTHGFWSFGSHSPEGGPGRCMLGGGSSVGSEARPLLIFLYAVILGTCLVQYLKVTTTGVELI